METGTKWSSASYNVPTDASNNKRLISSEELALIQQPDILLLKRQALDHIRVLLNTASVRLHHACQVAQPPFPAEVLQKPPKISVGENYRQLPYMVLDYPRFFTQQSTLAFRTMFWWGNHFSVSVHLTGHYLARYASALQSLSSDERAQNYYFCIHGHPWEYHFEADNYLLMREISAEMVNHHMSAHGFVKIADRLPLHEWKKLPEWAAQFYTLLWHRLNR